MHKVKRKLRRSSTPVPPPLPRRTWVCLQNSHKSLLSASKIHTKIPNPTPILKWKSYVCPQNPTTYLALPPRMKILGSQLLLRISDSDDKNDSTDDRESDVGIPLHGLNLGGRKKLLVIDLNGLLAHTFFTFENVKIPANRQPDGVLGTKLVFKRPFCEEFLKFCFEKFEVGIWSTATQRNVDGVITFIFGDFKPRLQFTWNQTHCTSTLFKTLENKDKPVFLKELKKLWDKECHSLPWPKGQYSSSNTLLIDDSPYKALLNPPNTAIFPHKFTVDQIEDNSLGPKGDLRAFLKGLAAAVDVQTYVKAHPYGQDAITANHPDWSYYSKIVGHFPHRLSH